jgi:ribosomal protein S18 acetylase RimI-like enzyme
VEVSGTPVGTLHLRRDGDTAGIYGFVIEPSRQGRGIGRAALRRACEQLRADGARRIGLEVDVQNDRALGLYTSVGFTSVATADYYALPLSAEGGGSRTPARDPQPSSDLDRSAP